MKNEERQALLDKLLIKELEELRKICFKYQRRHFIRNKIIICEDDLSHVDEKGALGLYEQIEKKNDFHYTHKISIHKRLIDDCLNYKYNKYEAWAGITKKYYTKKLKDTLLHEIIHAYCAEDYEIWSDIKGTDRDASPIFLSMLYFLGGKSNHHAAIHFKKTEMYKEIKRLNDWKEFNIYITKLILNYNKVAKNLGKIVNTADMNNVSMVTNKFEFAHRGMGLKASWTGIDDVVGKGKKAYMQSNYFNIGSAIAPDKIEALVNKKINNGYFQHTLASKTMVIDEKRVHTIEITKN